MRMLAAGLNAHGQFRSMTDDLYEFVEIASDVENIKCSTWSTLTWTTRSTVKTQGCQESDVAFSDVRHIHSVVGDHNGVLGMLYDRNLCVTVPDGYSARSKTIRKATNAFSPPLFQIAVASNGRTVAVQQRVQTMDDHEVDVDGSTVLLSEFSTFAAFEAWYAKPEASDCQPTVQHIVAGHVRQLVAGATSFALLTADGEVFTWGEARRCSLGRTVMDSDGKSTAYVPGVVAGLLGVRIVKICHGGWMFGAVSEDHAAYIWGLSMPRCTQPIRCLMETSEHEDVALIGVAGPDEDEPDVIDMDIGEGHAALVTSTGGLYVAGDNSNGQIGYASGITALPEWTRVRDLSPVVEVVCGPKSTVILTR